MISPSFIVITPKSQPDESLAHLEAELGFARGIELLPIQHSSNVVVVVFSSASLLSVYAHLVALECKEREEAISAMELWMSAKVRLEYGWNIAIEGMGRREEKNYELSDVLSRTEATYKHLALVRIWVFDYPEFQKWRKSRARGQQVSREEMQNFLDESCPMRVNWMEGDVYDCLAHVKRDEPALRSGRTHMKRCEAKSFPKFNISLPTSIPLDRDNSARVLLPNRANSPSRKYPFSPFPILSPPTCSTLLLDFLLPIRMLGLAK